MTLQLRDRRDKSASLESSPNAPELFRASWVRGAGWYCQNPRTMNHGCRPRARPVVGWFLIPSSPSAQAQASLFHFLSFEFCFCFVFFVLFFALRVFFLR